MDLIAGALDGAHVGEGDGPVGVGDGQKPLVKLVLYLRERQLVGVVVEGVLNVTRRLHV